MKAFPVSNELPDSYEEVLVHTGQHYDDVLSQVFFDELPIPEPDYNLGVGSGGHAEQTAEMMTQLDALIEQEAPDTVLVYGDTNSTLAAALVAAKRSPQLVHVEAGLRSHNWEMPEEVNRVVTDHISDRLCAPSKLAVKILHDEGLFDGVYLTGDVMYDALLQIKERALAQSTVLDELGYADGEYILATVHRPGNTDDERRLSAIIEGLATAPLPVVFPAHPRTVEALQRHGLWERTTDSLHLIDPVGYLDFVRLLHGAERIATDSGGVQKEAFYLDVHCVTLRDETEWMETVECGWNVLVGADRDAISRELRTEVSHSEKPTLYGGGTAAKEIVDVIGDQ
ncbi:non-hydrolyzing UDP-N-acetylglucosamine 2-epimerase [Halorarius litoreus]|uniref:non-hydrolyzing UDP-N-acetylglucosamine 2-epimerase n=1 Tax=Halorarius litoreus TaxID=2962676 RepID=UPI003D9C8B78